MTVCIGSARTSQALSRSAARRFESSSSLLIPACADQSGLDATAAVGCASGHSRCFCNQEINGKIRTGGHTCAGLDKADSDPEAAILQCWISNMQDAGTLLLAEYQNILHVMAGRSSPSCYDRPRQRDLWRELSGCHDKQVPVLLGSVKQPVWFRLR